MSPANKSSNPEEHRCQWAECTLLFNDAESLYNHITSTHIGRKANGTLELACQWAGCSSKATKRDHLTSHARVHINLKPHTCEICSKSFKRPQDLKKHEKIHTEEHHAHHKHSKAVTVNPPGSAGSALPPPLAHLAGVYPDASKLQGGLPGAPNGVNAFPGAFPGFPGFPYFGQHPMYAPHPGMSQLDVAQLIEHQRQLNAHVMNAAYGLPAPYGMPSFPGPGQFPNQHPGHSQGLPSMPMFSGAMPNPYSYPFFHPNQHPLGLATHPPPQQPGQPNSQQQQQQQHQSPTAPPPFPAGAHTSTPQLGSSPSLYPALPALGNMYPSLGQFVKQEGGDSPYSAHSPASTLSPKVPSLSLSPTSASASNGYSPSPEQSHDSLFHPRTNAVAGQKRAFEDAAGGFFADIKNKRFQEDDFNAHVENIDALAMLLTPTDYGVGIPVTQTAGSSPASDYSRADVEHINDILANLAQNIDELDAPSAAAPTSNGQFGDSVHARSHNQPHHHHHQQQYQQHHAQSHGVYPSLASFERPLAPLPARSAFHDAPANSSPNGLATIRMNKAPTAPSIAANETRHPNYVHLERLTRAAPTSSLAYRTSSSRTGSNMDLDDDEEDSFRPGRGYAASLRSTSMDEESELGPKLPPISSSTPTLPSTLPGIRDLLHFKSRKPELTGSTKSNLYPSISASVDGSSSPMSRPSSSAGGVGGLVPRFTRMGVRGEDESPEPSYSVSPSASAPATPIVMSEEPGELSADEESEDESRHTLVAKKSRVDKDIEVRRTRLEVLKALVVIVNESYRQSLAAQARAAAAAAAERPETAEIAAETMTVST